MKPATRVTSKGQVVIPKPVREQLRWTSGTQLAVEVMPASGTTACLGMLVAIYINLLAKRVRADALTAPLIASINAAAAAVDRAVPRLREPGPGTLFANYHVVAEP